jgi:4-hydroxy-L-threonine phosphate dehydrogenase PdxA
MGSRAPGVRASPERLRYVIDLTHEALCDLGFERPRIGVCALNPHAGEGGMFGREDIDVIAPVVQGYRAEGMDITGPFPGDTVYVKALAGQFDALVATYPRPGLHRGQDARLRHGPAQRPGERARGGEIPA